MALLCRNLSFLKPLDEGGEVPLEALKEHSQVCFGFRLITRSPTPRSFAEGRPLSGLRAGHGLLPGGFHLNLELRVW